MTAFCESRRVMVAGAADFPDPAVVRRSWEAGSAEAFVHDNAIRGIRLMEENLRAGVARFLMTGTVCQNA